MFRRIINLPIWHHPKLGLAARIAVAFVVMEVARAFGDVYSGRVIGASLVSDVFTSIIPMAWLPCAIGLGILANQKSGSLIVGWIAGAVAGVILLATAVQLDEALGLQAWL